MSKNFKGSPSDPIALRIDNAAAAGVTPLVTAVPLQKTRAYGLRLSVGGACIVELRRGSTVLERFNFAGAGGGIVLDLREEPYYTTAVNEALNLNSSAAVQVDGQLEYFTAI